MKNRFPPDDAGSRGRGHPLWGFEATTAKDKPTSTCNHKANSAKKKPYWQSGIRGQMSDVRGQMSDVRCQNRVIPEGLAPRE
ncbi:MAG: hypothetical protein FWC38_03495 [Proteobacteria bacterium]|nr:hypothetical protein [Pseudomonadota bacterium]